MLNNNLKSWINSGTPWVWMSAGAVSISLTMVFGLLILIGLRGLGYFWPADVAEYQYKEANGNVVKLLGETHEVEQVPTEQLRNNGVDVPAGQKTSTRYLLKTGNRDVSGLDFRWILHDSIQSVTKPASVIVIERREWGNFYGYLKGIRQDGNIVAEGNDARNELTARLDRVLTLFQEIQGIRKNEIGAINYSLERLRLQQKSLELENDHDTAKWSEIEKKKKVQNEKFAGLQQRLASLNQAIIRDSLIAEVADGRLVDLPLAKVVRIYQPNSMSILDKSLHYAAKLWEFVSDEPREANTEGGIFPAIFGTVLMVMIMSVLVTPFGVVAAVYLREYAKQGLLTRVIRIAVNNLAGVPSIVYGVFGLGFFVYFLGGNIDQLFFPEALPAPTFGTPGILWASLTLAILTLPVVIVATEEGLSRVPRSVREGSLALGATKAETLWRIVLPMARPALMTGLILAVARAAGEVAPLMLVGVVKLAPSLPLDGNFPFMHLDRKFMHLGFHIYDVGFQSPNVEAARPLVYATALLLVVVIVLLNLSAITIRTRLREKYRALES